MSSIIVSAARKQTVFKVISFGALLCCIGACCLPIVYLNEREILKDVVAFYTASVLHAISDQIQAQQTLFEDACITAINTFMATGRSNEIKRNLALIDLICAFDSTVKNVMDPLTYKVVSLAVRTRKGQVNPDGRKSFASTVWDAYIESNGDYGCVIYGLPEYMVVHNHCNIDCMNMTLLYTEMLKRNSPLSVKMTKHMPAAAQA